MAAMLLLASQCSTLRSAAVDSLDMAAEASLAVQCQADPHLPDPQLTSGAQMNGLAGWKCEVERVEPAPGAGEQGKLHNESEEGERSQTETEQGSILSSLQVQRP